MTESQPTTDVPGRPSGGGRRVPGVTSDALLVAGGTALSQVLTAAAFVVAARDVRPDQFGYMVALLTVVPVLTQALDWGSQANLTRRLSSQAVGGGHYRAWMHRRVCVFGLTAFVLAALVFVLDVPPIVWLGSCLYLWTLGVVQPARAWPQVQHRFGTIASGKVLGRAVTLGVTVAALGVPIDAVSAAALLPWGMAVGSAAEALFLMRTWPRPAGQRVSARAMWRGGGRIGIASLLGMTQQLDAAVVAAVAGVAQAGVYGAVSRWIAPLMLPSLAVGEVLYPRFASSSGRDGLRDAWRGARPVLVLSVVAAALAASVAEPLTSLLLGDAYAGSATVLVLLALGTIPLAFAAPVFTLLVARGHDREALASRTLGSGTALVLLPVLSYVDGAPGAAVALGIGNILFFASCCAFVVARLRRRPAARCIA